MYNFYFEIYLNDENGNQKTFYTTEHCDTELQVREIYRMYHDQMQVRKEEDEEGNPIDVPTGNRKFTIHLFKTKPVEMTKTEMQDFIANIVKNA